MAFLDERVAVSGRRVAVIFDRVELCGAAAQL
jgi:hypothetical protein